MLPQPFHNHLLPATKRPSLHPDTYNTLIEIIHEREEDISVVDTIRKIQQAEIAQNKKLTASNSSNTSGSPALYSTTGNTGRGTPSFRGRGGLRYQRKFRCTNRYAPKSTNTNGKLLQLRKVWTYCKRMSELQNSNQECFDCGAVLLYVRNKTIPPRCMYIKGKEAWERFQNRKTRTPTTL